MSKTLAILIISFITSASCLSAQDSSDVRTESNVIYGMHSGLALLMDIFYPTDPNGYGILVIPGSGFHQLMSYDATPLNKNPWYLSTIIGSDHMLKNGYTLFVINHRSAPVFRFPAAVEDAQRAVQFIRYHAEKYGIDRKNVGAIGHSSGAHLASMLGTMDDIQNPRSRYPVDRQSSKVQAVVALAGLYDLTTFASSGVGDIGAIASFVGTHLPAWRSPENPRDHEYEIYAKASPISHITSGDASFLLVHGTEDDVAPVDQSKMFEDGLTLKNISVTLEIIEGADHGFWIGDNVASNRYFDATIELFKRTIQNR